MTLKILVMIKQVPDPSRNRRMTAEGSIDRESTPAVMNRNCKNAVEQALAIKDAHPAEVTVMTMGPPKADIALREGISMGCDRAILLTDRKLAGSDTWSTAYALACAVRRFVRERYLVRSPGGFTCPTCSRAGGWRLGDGRPCDGAYDMVFAGMQTTDGDTAHVGPQLSERLDIPVVAYCERVTLEKDGSTRVRRIIEGGCELLRVKKLPCLFTITGTGNEPREPSLKGLIRAKRAQVISWNVDDVQADVAKIGLAGSPTIVYKVNKVEYTKPPCQVIRGSPEEMVRELLKRMAADKKLEVLGIAA